MPISPDRLQRIRRFPELIDYLRDELDWPTEDFAFDDLTFEYDPAELGLKNEEAVKVKTIHQLRPLHQAQPWGIFFVEFGKKRLPIVVLRRVLRHLVFKKRASASKAERPAWQARDLLFISATGEDADRELTFAHFVEREDTGLAELRVLGWDTDDTPLHMDYVATTLSHKLRWRDEYERDPEAWRREWSDAFRLRHGHVIRTAQELAIALAALARNLRSRIRTILRLEDGFGEIRKLQRAFKDGLIHDLDDDGFADMFAQTVAYGLFSVAARRTVPGNGTAFVKEDLTHYFTSPFLKEMLGIFLGLKSRRGKIDFDELGVSDVTDLLTSPDTHMEVVLADFNNKTRGEDPVIHFYEHFLSAYNKQLKIQRGVFYTPQPVVSYIVRSVHEILQAEFGLADGLADTTTWGAMIKRSADILSASPPSGQDARTPLRLPPLTDEPGEKRTISPDEPFVQILDPATGTATFLVEVIDVIHRHLSEQWKKGGLAAMPRLPERSADILSASPHRGQDARPPFLDPYADIAIHTHHLPHWQQGEVFYFVTYRLADSLPAGKLAEWQEEKDAWLRHHPEPWNAKIEAEYHQRFSQRMDAWLDAGHGSCLLRQPALARIAADAFHHFDGQRYDLDSFVVMPNHIHVLFRLRAGEALGKVIHSWKSFTAKAINKAAARTGTLWQEDYWDRIVRHERHHAAIRAYIRDNVKPGAGIHWQRSAGFQPASPTGGQDARTPFPTFPDYWNLYVPRALLPRLHAFELMMAPYAIAHMKIGLKLAETGYRFGTEERARIYLTNALEPKVQQLPQIGFDALAHEAAAVNEIKWYKRFTVVIGNPPYAGVSANMSEATSALIEPYKFVDGNPLGERKHWLQDDYVKFVRLAQLVVERAGVGVLGYITNHGYLDNPTFRGMRQNLMHSFFDIRVLDLHGSVKKRDAETLAKRDENVFDIEQGVAVGVFLRPLKPPASTIVHHASLLGPRAEKYEWLTRHALVTQTQLNPSSPYYFFVKREETHREEYEVLMSVTSVFQAWSTGVQTSRDSFAVAPTRQELEKRLEEFLSATVSDQRLKDAYGLKDMSFWRVAEVRRDFRRVAHPSSYIRPIDYRPFDTQYVIFHEMIIHRPKAKVMRHMLAGENLALLLPRQLAGEDFHHALCSRSLAEMCVISTKTTEQNNLFPLYLYEEEGGLSFSTTETKKRRLTRSPNFTPQFLRTFAKALGIQPAGPHGLPAGLTPEDIFHYAYAVFHSPGYRSRYAEFLKIDFPRLPLTGNLALFRALARLGGELVGWHLLERSADVPSAGGQDARPPFVEYIRGQDARAPVEKISWSRDTVWVDKAQTTGFRGVPEAVWNFHIGGYQVCAKWLKDRKGRELTNDDLAHYQKIVIALAETIRLMAEIDELIEQHGGWPLK